MSTNTNTPASNPNDFTTGAIFPKLTKFMIPILGALILQAMYGAVDVLMVGQFGTDEAISAVSTGSNIINMVVFTVAAFSTAVTVLMGHYLGEGRPQKIADVLGCAIAFFAIVAVALMVLLLTCAQPLALLLQAPEAALSSTVLYVRICGGGIIFIIAYNLISSVFRGLGNSKLPLIFVGIACVVNIVGDYVFVALMGLSVAGAALATVTAQAVSVLLSLFIISKTELPFTFKMSDIRLNKELKRMIVMGAPMGVQEFTTQLSFLALCAFINKLGLAQSSGYGVANKLVGFMMLLPSSLMQSMASFVAQNVGARKELRSRRAMVTGMLIGGTVGIFLTLAAVFLGVQMASLFTPNEEYMVQASAYLKGFALEAILTSILFSFIGYFNGHGMSLFVLFQGLIQTFLVRLPMAYIMSIQPGATLTMIGLATPSATIVGITINVIFYKYYTGRMKDVA